MKQKEIFLLYDQQEQFAESTELLGSSTNVLLAKWNIQQT